MIWDETASPAIIIMLTQTHESGKEKCFPYFPLDESQPTLTINETNEFGDDFIGTLTLKSKSEDPVTRSTIRELSTPIIPVYAGILVLPLVGAIDSRRATEVTERLLEAIAAEQAETVIIDITGVSMIDTSTANHLLMTTRAAGLLGSHVVLVGMGPEVAQTIVQLGIELQGLTTLANLQAGIAYALGRLQLGIQPLAGRARGV